MRAAPTRVVIRNAIVIWVTVALSAATIALIPVGAQAAGQLMTIVDADSSAKAHVEGGKLRVGDGSGAMTVNGALTARDTFAGRTPFYDRCILSSASMHNLCPTAKTVPAGKVLVVTHVSAHIELPSTHTVRSLALNILHDDVDQYAGRITLSADRYDDIGNGRRVISYSQQMELPVRAGSDLRFSLSRAGTDTDAVQLIGTVQGYLVPAT